MHQILLSGLKRKTLKHVRTYSHVQILPTIPVSKVVGNSVISNQNKEKLIC